LRTPDTDDCGRVPKRVVHKPNLSESMGRDVVDRALSPMPIRWLHHCALCPDHGVIATIFAVGNRG
jgi:hypothetical protein